MDNQNDIFKVDENQQSKDKQKKVVFVLGIAIVIVAITLTIILVGALVSANSDDESEIYETTEPVNTITTTTEFNVDDLMGVDDVVTNDQGDGGNASADSSKGTSGSSVTAGATKNQIIESYEHLAVNGENKLSDHCENEFIKLISTNYDVDGDLLVAIYSVPDSGTNFVLEFSGKKNLKGEYVKSPDTLVRVYQIDLEKNVKVATGKPTGNEGVSYAESVMCFNMVKTIVMKQYPDYFTGIE